MSVAESEDGKSRLLVASLTTGQTYRHSDIASIINVDPKSMSRKGVYNRKGDDYLLLFVTLDKSKTNITYFDHLSGATLFWSAQNKQKYAEQYIEEGKHDIFVFIKKDAQLPYTYYGRALPLRIQFHWELGIPSRIVFNLYEYEQLLFGSDATIFNQVSVTQNEPHYALPQHVVASTEDLRIQKVRTAQQLYRNEVLALWNNRCAVTGVDNSKWLIASHIKPWSESSNEERIDAHNSLLLSPNYDKLFDRGVISFSPDTGKIVLPEIQTRSMWNNLEKMGIDDTKHLADVPVGTDVFLRYHNQYVYGFNAQKDVTSEQTVESLVVHALS